jgi:hypothetical protein
MHWDLLDFMMFYKTFHLDLNCEICRVGACFAVFGAKKKRVEEGPEGVMLILKGFNFTRVHTHITTKQWRRHQYGKVWLTPHLNSKILHITYVYCV